MKITREDVLRVAELAHLELSDAEIDLFGRQLDSTLTYADKLNELDTAGVEPMVHGIEGRQMTRPDAVGESLPRKEALRNAPDQSEGCFKVPRIIE